MNMIQTRKGMAKRFFYILLLLDMAYTYLYLIRNSGENIYTYLYNDIKDYYMDFFNSIYHVKDFNPYAIGSIYPPFTYMIYGFFRRLIPDNIMVYGGFGIRNSQNGQVVFIIYSVLIIIFIYVTTHKIQSEKTIESHIFPIIVLLSYPFIFAFERGNIVILAASICYVFITNYDSKNLIFREVSIICLAVAINIKIYPIIYSLLFLKRNRIPDFIKLTVYSIILFIIPFRFMGGISFANIKKFLSNILFTNNIQSSVSFPYLVSLKHAFDLIFKSVRIEADNYIMLMVFIYVIALIISFFVANEEWQEVMALSILVVSLPSMSSIYSIVFLFPAVFLFLDNAKRSIKHYIMFLIIYMIMKYPQSNLVNYHILSLISIREVENISIHLKSIYIFILSNILIFEIIINRINERMRVNKSNEQISE